MIAMANPTPLHALIVEDSAPIRADMKALLTKMGVVVTEAENGLEAWRLLQKVKSDPAKKPEVIISDVNMPELDGLQLLEKVRAENEIANIPFIITTANKEELLRMTALCLNVTAFYIKPPDPEQLLSQLKKVFPLKKFQR